MRRGFTIIELLTSITVLAAILGVALPLFFMGDKALGLTSTALSRQATAAHLLGDLSRDARTAGAATSDGGATLGEAVYRYDAATDTTLRQAPSGLTTYAHVRFTLSSDGRLTRISVRGHNVELTTLVLRRNG
jgi:prepilin-type N-terminal cleavage/methylation domain-containing protein